jgi:iron complex outermembrane receptor protein
VVSFELGYRIRPIQPLSVSIAAFYNFYEDLRSLDEVSPDNFVLGNHFKGEVRGVEVSADFAPTEWWRLRAGYTYLHKDLWSRGGNDATAGVREGNDPDHQFTFQSIFDLPGNFQLDVTGRYADSLPAPSVPDYVALDTRLAWQYRDVEIALIGQNLLESEHREFGMNEIPRSVYGKITLRF